MKIYTKLLSIKIHNVIVTEDNKVVITTMEEDNVPSCPKFLDMI